jgi:hypothetical protein
VAAPNREWSISKLEVPQDGILGNSQPSLRDSIGQSHTDSEGLG